MLARHRQSLILQAVRNDGSARVSDLTQRLGVSDMTIRRDLEVLARDGLVEKVHGGAVLPGTPCWASCPRHGRQCSAVWVGTTGPASLAPPAGGVLLAACPGVVAVEPDEVHAATTSRTAAPVVSAAAVTPRLRAVCRTGRGIDMDPMFIHDARCRPVPRRDAWQAHWHRAIRKSSAYHMYPRNRTRAGNVSLGTDDATQGPPHGP